jgi:hypothetical protein
MCYLKYIREYGLLAGLGQICSTQSEMLCPNTSQDLEAAVSFCHGIRRNQSCMCHEKHNIHERHAQAEPTNKLEIRKVTNTSKDILTH